MKIQINKRTPFVLLIFYLVLFTGTYAVSAEEMLLEDAIKHGLENNKDINETREKINNLERTLERINLQSDWKFNLGVDYTHNFGEQDGQNLFNEKNSTSTGDGNLSILANKTYLSGLNLTPRISIDEDIETDFTISLRKVLYPQLPSELMINYYNTEKNLIKVQKNLREVKAKSILSWLDGYSNIKSMVSRQDIYTENFIKAENNFKKVLERQRIGDAGRNEILVAELGLKNARYSLKEAENQLEDALYAFFSSLGLPLEKEIIITDNERYIAKLFQSARKYTGEFLEKDMDELMMLIVKNNSQLNSNLIDREILEKELEWLKKEDNPELSFNSSYNSNNDNLSLSLSLSYQLYDGGQHKMNIEDKEKEIADSIKNYNDIYKQLKQELKQLLDKLELSEMALERGKLSLERNQYELEVAEKQLEMGLIDYLEYQDSWIAEAEAEIQINVLEEWLFINRMEFIKFLDLDLAYEIIGGI